MSLPPAVSEAEWRTARSRLLTKEKQATRALDALAAERRRLPMVRIEKEYEFEGPDGRASKARMGWTVPWFSSHGSDFNYDFEVSGDDGETFALSVFLRDGETVYRTYVTSERGVDRPRIDFNLLDLTPLGRQEEWEDSPVGWPQTPAYLWWEKHDEYHR
jgi:predicted dithiol-disulfide oxidoreductase (DUF899 family)